MDVVEDVHRLFGIDNNMNETHRVPSNANEPRACGVCVALVVDWIHLTVSPVFEVAFVHAPGPLATASKKCLSLSLQV